MAHEHAGSKSYYALRSEVTHLERRVQEVDDPAQLYALHREAATIWDRQLGAKSRALYHLQQAYLCNTETPDPVVRSLALYWELGRLEPVFKLVEILDHLGGDAASRLRWRQQALLAAVLLGAPDAVAESAKRVLELAPSDPLAQGILSDVSGADAGRMDALLAEPGADAAPQVRGAMLARMLDRESDAIEPLQRRIAAQPHLLPLWMLLEHIAQRNDAVQDVFAWEKATLDAAADAELTAGAAYRWFGMLGDEERACALMEDACALAPRLPWIYWLFARYDAQGDRDAQGALLERVSGRLEGEWRVAVLETAVQWWGTELRNVDAARAFAQALAAADPNNGIANQFFEECDMTNNSGTDHNDRQLEPEEAGVQDNDAAQETASNADPFAPDASVSDDLAAALEAARAASDPAEAVAAWQKAWEVDPGHPMVLEGLVSVYEQTGDWAKLADFLKRNQRKVADKNKALAAGMLLARVFDEYLHQDTMVVSTLQGLIRQEPTYGPALDAACAKFEAMERWPDLVKTLKLKAEITTDPADALPLWQRIADLFANRFSNQAEAMKAYEKVLEYDPNNEEAVAFLTEMYEKRRDYNRLLELKAARASALPDGPDKLEALLDIARVATEKVRKPDICITHWEAVRAVDPEHPEALEQLAFFYERAKEWEKLAAVLEVLAANATDPDAQQKYYQTLGTVWADKAGDPARAVDAWKAYLEIVPDDRRGQEQLKKCYLAMEAWEELEAFYAQNDKWDEFIRVLEREASSDKTPAEKKVSLYTKLAQLYRDVKERPDKARAALEAILDVDPHNLDAAHALIPVYEESGDAPAKLADVLEIALSAVEDEEERIAQLRRIGALCEGDAADPSRAFDKYLEVFSLRPYDAQAREDLERASAACGRWDEVVRAYEQAWQSASGQDAVDVRIAMARVLNEELGRSDEALEHFNAILQEDPDNPKAVRALERLYAQLGRFEELLDIYAKRIEMAQSDEEKKEIYYSQAMLWEEEIDDPQKAIDVYLQIIDLAGDESRALAALERLYSRAERWQDAADALERLLASGDLADEDAVRALHRLGELRHQHLGDFEGALAAFEEVISRDPEFGEVIASLERLVAVPEVAPRAAAALVPLYEAREEWEQFVRVLEIVADNASGSEKVEQFLRAGAVCKAQLDAPERAFAAYSKAFLADPGAEEALQQLEELTAVLDAYEDFVSLLQQGAQAADDPAVAGPLWMKAAAVCDVQLEKVDQAIHAYRQAAACADTQREAVQALEGLFAREERWADLVAVLRTKADFTDDLQEKIEVLRYMGRINEEMLDAPDDATAVYAEVLSLDPTDLETLRKLDALYVRLEKWTDLADNLQQQLAVETDPDALVALKLRLAALQETHLEQRMAAVQMYKEVFDLDPGNEKAVAALEALLSDPELQVDVATTLEPIYRENGDWEKLVGVLEILVAHEQTPERQVELLFEIATLFETAGDAPEKAFATLGRALEIAPDQDRIRDELERMARALDMFEDLVALYEKRVESLDGDLALTYHLGIAQIAEEQLQDNARAQQHYKAVLAIDPMHLDAVNALERVYQIEEKYEDLAAVYLKKAEMLPDLEEQKDVLFKAAQVYEEVLENSEQAIAVYRRILDVDADDLRAVTSLEGLYLRLERWEELQEIYNQKVDLVTTAGEKKEVLYVLGAMYERELHDASGAITTYQRILEFDPDDQQALSRLDILFAQGEQWDDLLSVLEREAELAADPDEAISFKYRIAELYVRRLDDIPRAVEYLREVLTVAPDHKLAIGLLEELLHGDAEPLAAADVLEPIYQEEGAWRKLVDLLEVRIAHTDDPWQKVELLHQEVQLLQSDLHLDAPAEAFDTCVRALEIDPANEESLRMAQELAHATDKWAALAAALDRIAESSEDDDVVRKLGLEAARIYEENLDDADKAIARCAAVLEVDEENRDALGRLERLYQIGEQWEQLAEVLRKQVAIAMDVQESLDLQYRLGRLYQLEMEDAAQAVAVYRDILAAEPTYEQAISALDQMFAQGLQRAEILEVLEPLLQMQGEWEKLVSLYRHQLEDLETPADKVQMLLRIAETYEEKLMDPVEAFSWTARAFVADPSDPKAAEDVERLAQVTDMWKELADTYSQVFAAAEDLDQKKAVGKKFARVAEEELADAARAQQAYVAVLELDPEDRDVLVALDRVYTQYMEWERLVPILDRLAAVTQDGEERIAYLFRMADVLETQLDAPKEAQKAFHRIVDDLDPTHKESLLRLEVLYADQEDWKGLLGVYDKMVACADNGAEEAETHAKMALLCAECLDDIDGAIGHWTQVLDLLGEDMRALEGLADLYARKEEWSELVDILERAVTVAESDEDRIRLYSQLGVVWGECLGRDRNALDNWQNVLAIDWENLRALKAIAAIHEANQEWEELIETLERIIEAGAATLELDELKHYYFKLASTVGDVLERREDVVEIWRRVLEIDPSEMRAVTALEAVLRELERYDELADILAHKATLLEGEQQVACWLEQARVLEEQVGTPLAAREPYLNILQVDPLHEHAFARCEAIMTEQEAWEELIQLYSHRLEYVQEIPERIALLHKAALVYEQRMERLEDAFVVMQQAFALDYANDETGEHLERLASETGKWQELFAACNQLLATETAPKVQVDLCLRIGKWYAAVGNPEYAIQYYQQVLTLDSSNARALVAMGDLYRDARQWPELVEVLKRAAEYEEDPQRKKNILVELGEVYMEYIQDIPEAKRVFKEALAIDPALEPALVSLERMFRATENWEELIPVLRAKLAVLDETDVDALISARMKIASIYEENLKELQLAIDEYKAILELDAGYWPALSGLDRLYGAMEMWQDEMDVLELQLDHAPSDGERVEALTKLAQLLEVQFRRPDAAIERLEEVLTIDPRDLQALENLERLYRATGRWEELVDAYDKHIDAVAERDARIPLFMAKAAVLAKELRDIDRAMDAYREVLDIDPDHVDALDELARLQVVAEDWGAALDTLERLVDTVQEPERKVDLYYRLGELCETQLMDRGAAVEHLRSALDIEPGHVPALMLLKQIHVEEGEWLAAAEVLESLQEFTEVPRKKSALQYELGALYRDRLSDEETAISWFEKAIATDADNQEAALPLVDVYIEAERFEEAEKLLQMLVRLGGKRPVEEKRALYSKLGLVCDRLGKLDEAVDAYQSAYDLDTQNLESLLQLADVLYRTEQWDKAFKLYQMVLVHHRDEQTNDEIVEIFYRLGMIKAALKERRKALNMFDKALEIDGGHVPTLEAVIALQEEQKNFEQVIHFKKILIDAVQDEDRQFALWQEIGDIWHQKLKNPQKAISSYQEALAIRPDSRPVLHKLLPLYQATKQWPNVVDVISRVCEMETDPDKLARLYYSMGVVYRDEIKNAEEAVRCFNLALDNSLENLKAFEAIDRILTQQKNWKQLERNYRKMIHRITGKGKRDIEINLWHFLGEIYRTRMGQFEAAAEAFKMASKLDPDNLTRHEILAELYTRMPDRLADAVAEHQEIIARNPFKVDSYKALRRLYFEHRQYDKAWCLCATLSFLKKADAEEQQFFEQYRPKGTVRAQARLDNEAWIKHLFHPDESVYIGKIFEMVTNAVRRYKVQPAKNLGLKKSQKRPQNDTLTFSKTFFYAAQVINLPTIPELYIREDSPDGLSFALTDPVASACGSALLSGYTPQELLFVVTKHLAYYRPEHYIRWLLPSHRELKALMLAAIKLANPQAKVPTDPGLEQLKEQLAAGMDATAMEGLRKVVKHFLATGEQVDLKRWIRALDLTACRAGFLLCGDLETAARMLQNEPVGIDDMSAKEKIKELVLFSVSESYFTLRQALGFSIGV